MLAARALDKCRAVLVGWQGEYHSNCPLDQRWLKFAEIDYGTYRSFVATGVTDDEVAAWIGDHAKKRSRAEVIVWNNQQRVSPTPYSSKQASVLGKVGEALHDGN